MRRGGKNPRRLAEASVRTAGALLLALAAATPAAALTGAQQAGVASPPSGAAAEVDGIAAVANGEVITLGEVHRAALLRRDTADAPGQENPGLGGLETPGGCGVYTGSSPVPRAAGSVVGSAPERALTDAELTPALECLIDSRLVFREVRRFPQLDPPGDSVAEQYEALVEAFGGQDAFEAELQRLALTSAGVRRDLHRQHLVAAYIDSRFRETTDVAEDEIARYYDEEVVPDLLGQGIEVPALEDIAEPFIIPILREREVNRRVQSWISDLRDRAVIQRRAF